MSAGWGWGKTCTGRSLRRILLSLKLENKRGRKKDSGRGNEDNERNPEIRVRIWPSVECGTHRRKLQHDFQPFALRKWMIGGVILGVRGLG